MFPQVLKQIVRAASLSHKNGKQKLVALIAALFIVGGLVPIPKDLRGIFAAVDSEIELGAGDIIVDSSLSDTVTGGCAVLADSTPGVNTGPCTLRDAVDLAQTTPGSNRIVFDDSVYGDITLDTPLELTDSDGLIIEGSIINDEPAVHLLPSAIYDNNQGGVTSSACTSISSAQLPLIHIEGDNNYVARLMLTSSSDYSLGNIVQIVDSNGNGVLENWIGTDTREPNDYDYVNNGGSGHGVCIAAVTDEATTNEVSGNIIVGNAGDGIRVEGAYYTASQFFERLSATGSVITNNLIGNLTGGDTRGTNSAYQGNGSSGITLKIADESTIRSNIITNNGDGITLLEAMDNLILGNYIGSSPFDTDHSTVASDFPFSLTENNRLVLPTNVPAEDFSNGYNNCDGIGIRFYDSLVGANAPDECTEATTDFPNSNDYDGILTPSSQLLGPSIHNKIFNNTIAHNYRNGIYVQSLACNIHAEDGVRHNLPNIILDGDDEPVIIQSVQNSFIQNSIFANDSNINQTETGSGSFGIGIDLEDYATAALDIPDQSDISNTYWSVNGLNEDEYDCQTTVPAWQPDQPASTEMDFNITENDNFAHEHTDIAVDPDAGANRLVNAPRISATSTISAITGTAPRGSLVELYQVICETGDQFETLPNSLTAARNNCDIDYWNEENESEDIFDSHKLGHGQGYRFLGNYYIPASSLEETWTINPSDFTDGEDNSVAPFVGGIITATATAIDAACWDSATDTNDAHLCNNALNSASFSDISSAAAGSVDADTGLWVPGDLEESCLNGIPPSVPNYYQLQSAILADCFGSTSEFSANAYIAAPAYLLSKHTITPDLEGDASNEVAPGDTVSYHISVTNTGSSILDLPAGSLSDVLDDSLTYTGCEWEITDINGDPLTDGDTCTGTTGNVLNTTDFGELEIGATLDILIHTTVRTGLTGAACSINNTIVAEDILDMLGAPASETGATLADNVAEEVVVTPCAAPNLTVQKTVSVAGAAETSVNTSASSSAPIAGVGGAVTYYIDVANSGSSTATGVTLTDTFPSQLGLAGWTCASTTATGSTLASHSSVSYSPGCSVSSSTGVITTATSIGANSVLRIRLTGLDVPTAANNTAICNSVTATGFGGLTASDSACVRVGVPSLSLVKTASDTTPDAGSTVTYTISVTNTGGFPANNVQVSDDLDDTSVGNTVIPQCVATIAGIAVQDSGSINSSTNTLSWTISSIPAGETRAVHFTAAVRPDIATATSCPNVARATSDNAPSVTGTVTIAVGIPVDGAVLSISKQAVNESDIYELGDAVHYRVTVENSGTTTSSNLSVRDSIPSAEEDLRLATSTSGTVSTTGDELNVSGMSVAADGSAVVNYTVSIAEDDDFPLRSYRLDQDADADDEQFYPERVRDDDVADSAHDDAEDALGARDEAFVSLGSGGEIVLDIASRRSGLTKLLVDGDGDDFCIAEQDLAGDTDRDTERYTVSVSQTTRSRDFERVGRSNGGSDCFDIGDADLTWARYIQIEDTSGSVSGDAPGVDVDAVCLLNLGGMVTNTAGLYQSEELLGTSEETILVDFTDAFEDPAEESDCRTNAVTIAADPLPNPPVELPPAPPVYVAPPVFQLPKTGPVAAGAPVLGGTGILSAMWWMLKRRRS